MTWHLTLIDCAQNPVTTIELPQVLVQQLFGVLFCILGISLKFYAMYDDVKFEEFLNKKAAQNWTNDPDLVQPKIVRPMAPPRPPPPPPVDLPSIPWIQAQRKYERGKFDWILLAGLIAMAVVHFILLLFLRIDISIRVKHKEEDLAQAEKRNKDLKNLRQSRKTIQLSTSAVPRKTRIQQHLEVLQSSVNSKILVTKRISSAHASFGESNVKTSFNESLGTNLLTVPEQQGEDVDLDLSGVEEALAHSRDKEQIRLAKRNWNCLAHFFVFGAFVTAVLTLYLSIAVIFDTYLVTSLNQFYLRTHTPKETHPFPEFCRVDKRKEFLGYYGAHSDHPKDLVNQGICNDYVSKSGVVGLSIIIIVISVSLCILYLRRYRVILGKQTELLETVKTSIADSASTVEVNEGEVEAEVGRLSRSISSSMTVSNSEPIVVVLSGLLDPLKTTGAGETKSILKKT